MTATPSPPTLQRAAVSVPGERRDYETANCLPARPERRSRGSLRLALFFVVLLATAFCLDAALKAAMRTMSTGDVGALNRALQGHVTADIVISGSSRALVQYDPQLIQEVTGRTAFNFGRNASHTEWQAIMLQAFLATNRAPKMVIQNLDIHSFEPADEIYEPAQYAPYLADAVIYQGLRALEPNAWKWRFVPLYLFAVEDMKLLWVRAVTSVFTRKERNNQGYFPNDRTWTGDFERFRQEHNAGVRRRIEPRCVSAMREIVAACRQRGVQLIFVYPPEFKPAQELTTNRAEVFALFRKISAEAGAPFIDFSDSSLSEDQSLFYNSQHLNRRGASLFSRELAEKLRSLRSEGSGV